MDTPDSEYNDIVYSGPVATPVGTNFAKLFIHLLYFIFINTRAVIYSAVLDWTLIIRHPVQTITKIIFVPAVSFALAFLSVLFIVAGWLGAGKLLVALCKVYGVSSVANCGYPSPFSDEEHNVIPGLDKMTNGGTPEFDFDIAKSLLYFSALMYEQPLSLQRILSDLTYSGHGRVHVIAQHYEESRQVALFQFSSQTSADRCLIVSFKGTSMLDLDQWLLDANMAKTDAQKYVFGAVHQGFFRALFQRNMVNKLSIYEALILNIKAVMAANQKEKGRNILFVTGHSLGAAMASLFFARASVSLDLHGIELGGCYTYGNPRTGNLQFRDQYTFVENRKDGNTARLYRIVNALDPVPHIPLGFDDPDTMGLSASSSSLDPLNYCHIGTPIFLHPYEANIPETRPKWIPVTLTQFIIWYAQNVIAAIGLSSWFDFFVEWVLVVQQFFTFLSQPKTYAETLNFIFVFVTQCSMAADHLPSRYLHNLLVKEKADTRLKALQAMAEKKLFLENHPQGPLWSSLLPSSAPSFPRPAPISPLS